MANIGQIFDDVRHRLISERGVTCENIKSLQERPFSNIYELECRDGSKVAIYILKISKTGRLCFNEFDKYNLLADNNILTLKTVIVSSVYNYIVTEKEQLSNFEELERSGLDMRTMLEKFGAYLKKIENATISQSSFAVDDYKNYIFKRIETIKYFNVDERRHITAKINWLLQVVADTSVSISLVSDLSFGNIHVTTDGNIMLLDMGDACFDNSYSNIAGMYISIKYGPKQQYFENNRKTDQYFKSFMSGYGAVDLIETQFVLYQIKHLLPMILYLEKRSIDSNRVRKLISKCADKYLISKYTRHLFKLLEKNYES